MREQRLRPRGRFLRSILSLSIVLLALPAWTQTYQVIHVFTDQDNLYAGSVITQDAAGNLYGASWYSEHKCHGDTCGAIYKVTPTGTLTLLHEFKGSPDGEYPVGLVADETGTLYGTTTHGGTSTFQNCNGHDGCGTLFEMTSSGKETILHSFSAPPTDGIEPLSGVIVSNGSLYGTTYFGGTGNAGFPGDGTIYEFADGIETVLYNFTDGPQGGFPGADPLLLNGTLYGTTVFGGTGPCETTYGYGCGTVFEFERAKTVRGGTGEHTLYEFQGGADGGFPAASLIADNEGNLYGTTVLGGDLNCNISGPPPGCGVAFKLTQSGQETVLHTFTGGSDGAWPSYALVMDAAGNLYGTAYFGGDLNCEDEAGLGCGTIFKIDTAGNFSVIHTFEGEDGSLPVALILNGSTLYGVAGYGGPDNRGVVYGLTLP